MSMLDSYQHHYLLSLVLLAMMFFPPLSAEDALLVPRAAEPKSEAAPSPRAGKKKRKKEPRAAKPAPRGADPLRATLFGPIPYVSAWAYALLSGSVAIVYAYTAYSKSDPEWLSGAALKSVVRLPASGVAPDGALDPIGPFRSVMSLFGLEGEPMWWLLGHSVVLVQIVCAAGYLLAPLRDAPRSDKSAHWIPRAFAWVAMLTALSFHLGAEYMDLKIGWFSWYMVGYALIFFLPARALAVIARVLLPLQGPRLGPEALAMRITLGVVVVIVGASAGTWTEAAPFGVSLAGIFGEGLNMPLVLLGVAILVVPPIRLFARAPMTTKQPAASWRNVALGTVGAGALGLVGMGTLMDLPGAQVAGVFVGVGLGALVVQALVRGDDVRHLHGFGVGAAVGALALLACVVFTDVRWDFYRNVGGDHRRRGEYRTAYEAYVKANRYAPEGEDRQRQQDEMEQRMRGRAP